LVEDCAQAHGARYRGAPVGGFGAIGCFSFYPTKNLGAYGDGGICVTRDPALAERLRMLRMYGFRGDRHAHCEGLLSRLDELQAAILRVKLRHLDAALDARRRIAGQYLRGLEGSGLGLPVEPPERRHARHLFVVRAPDRARVTAALERAGIGFGIHYPEPVHRMEAYRAQEFAAEPLPVTERASEEVLSLPLYPGLAADSVERVIETLCESA
jgi:dTDP-4-amino-4,6-dideoxygalactose transaminase